MERDELAARWPLAGTALRDRLLDAWGHPARGYHDLAHLREVLDRLAELTATEDTRGVDLLALELAAWFHDAVYDAAGRLEERSAAMAEAELDAEGVAEATVAETARLVRLTEHHRPDPDDTAGALLCDADLAVLAAGPERYAGYVAGVRAEHARLPAEVFRAGRAAVLEDLARAPSLFHTRSGRDRWESTARANLATELAVLRRAV